MKSVKVIVLAMIIVPVALLSGCNRKKCHSCDTAHHHKVENMKQERGCK